MSPVPPHPSSPTYPPYSASTRPPVITGATAAHALDAYEPHAPSFAPGLPVSSRIAGAYAAGMQASLMPYAAPAYAHMPPPYPHHPPLISANPFARVDPPPPADAAVRASDGPAFGSPFAQPPPGDHMHAGMHAAHLPIGERGSDVHARDVRDMYARGVVEKMSDASPMHQCVSPNPISNNPFQPSIMSGVFDTTSSSPLSAHPSANHLSNNTEPPSYTSSAFENVNGDNNNNNNNNNDDDERPDVVVNPMPSSHPPTPFSNTPFHHTPSHPPSPPPDPSAHSQTTSSTAFAPNSMSTSTTSDPFPVNSTPVTATPPHVSSSSSESSSAMVLPTARFELRAYQKRIIRVTKAQNTLVVLPTGAGKTLIAAETIVQCGTPALFFVPTVMLVQQQHRALLQWTQMDVQPFCGKMQVPGAFDILVATPKAFEMAQAREENAHFQWANFTTIIFDEVHHVIKQHPYRHVALALRASEVRPRVVGLTASYTYAMEEDDVKMQLSQMCDELRIEQCAAATDDELREGGYHARAANAERYVNLERDRPKGVLPPERRKPHLMLETFLNRIKKCQSTRLSYALTQVVLQMEKYCMCNDTSFVGPVTHGSGVRGWVKYVHDKATQQNKKAINSMLLVYAQLEYWYEALRVLVTSWEEDEYAAVMILRMGGLDREEAMWPWPDIVCKCMRAFWRIVPDTFVRLERLKEVLIRKMKQHQPFRGLVFVQQRITTHALAYFIEHDAVLGQQLSTACLYSQNGPISHCKSLSKSESAENLEMFANGKVNMLLTTVVAEEGMDIPSANCVIRFDGMHTAVSLVQGRGRARQADSSFVVLKEMEGRGTGMLEDVERKQRELIHNGHGKIVKSKEDMKRERLVQKSRELNSEEVVYSKIGGALTSLGVLHMFCQKTKVQMMLSLTAKNGQYECKITYQSCLRVVIGVGVAKEKRIAKQVAAGDAIRKLQLSFAREKRQNAHRRGR